MQLEEILSDPAVSPHVLYIVDCGFKMSDCSQTKSETVIIFSCLHLIVFSSTLEALVIKGFSFHDGAALHFIIGEVKYVDALLYYNPSVLAGTSWAANIYIYNWEWVKLVCDTVRITFADLSLLLLPINSVSPLKSVKWMKNNVTLDAFICWIIRLLLQNSREGRTNAKKKKLCKINLTSSCSKPKNSIETHRKMFYFHFARSIGLATHLSCKMTA